jgi:membrane protein
MKLGVKGCLGLFKTAAKDWVDDHAPRLGAALGFYTIFSLAPLLTIVITIASLWLSENAGTQIFNELGGIIGQDAARNLQEVMVQKGERSSGIFTAVSATVMLLVGATGVFVQLQDSLNQIWEVKLKPGQGIKGFIRNRLLSFAMVLGIAFLLLTSLLLTAGIAAAGKYFSHWFGELAWLFQILNVLVSFGLITVLFALMFKFVPDAEIAWRDVWFGAIVTSFLFNLGKFGLGVYLGKSSVVSTYSAAGGLLIVLLWVYYTSQIVFFGAELTQAWAYAVGREVKPSKHAQWDDEKACQTNVRKEERNREEIPSPAAPEPAFAMRSSYKPANAGRIRPATVTRALGGLFLLLLTLLPFQGKRLGRSKG